MWANKIYNIIVSEYSLLTDDWLRIVLTGYEPFV